MKRKIAKHVEPPKGFYYFPNFISPAEEKKILIFISKLKWQEVKMHGIVAKRRVVHFGLNYKYEGRSVAPGAPIPKPLLFLIERCAQIDTVKSRDIKQILITFYPIGAGIGWHRDAEVFDQIIGISLKNDCIIKLRKKNETTKVYKQILKPCSAYLLSGGVRYEWEHTIPAVKEERYSITLRTLI